MLNRLRKISRLAYALGISLNNSRTVVSHADMVERTQLRKLIEETIIVISHNKRLARICGQMQKLLELLSKKQKAIHEFIANARKASALGRDRSQQRSESKHSESPLSSLHSDKEWDSLKVGRSACSTPKAHCRHCEHRDSAAESPRDLDSPLRRFDRDLRKRAIMNNMAERDQHGPSPTSAKSELCKSACTSPLSPGFDSAASDVVTAFKLSGNRLCTPGTENGLDDSTPKKDHLRFEEVVDAARELDAGRRRSRSVTLIQMRLLDLCMQDEYIDQLFSGCERDSANSRKGQSHEPEGEENEYEDGVKRSNSCILDYAFKPKAGKAVAPQRSNSLELVDKDAAYDEDHDSILKGKKYPPHLLYPACRVSIDDFKFIKGLSSGAYGQVCLVQKSSSSDYFAMKIIDRQLTLEMEYMNGGDLGHLLENCGSLDEKVSFASARLEREILHGRDHHRPGLSAL